MANLHPPRSNRHRCCHSVYTLCATATGVSRAPCGVSRTREKGRSRRQGGVARRGASLPQAWVSPIKLSFAVCVGIYCSTVYRRCRPSPRGGHAAIACRSNTSLLAAPPRFCIHSRRSSPALGAAHSLTHSFRSPADIHGACGARVRRMKGTMTRWRRWERPREAKTLGVPGCGFASRVTGVATAAVSPTCLLLPVMPAGRR